MTRRANIDASGKPAAVISVRFANDVVEMIDLLAENRSKFVRDATLDKIKEEMTDEEG